jgi:hypothetical protein
MAGSWVSGARSKAAADDGGWRLQEFRHRYVPAGFEGGGQP